MVDALVGVLSKCRAHICAVVAVMLATPLKYELLATAADTAGGVVNRPGGNVTVTEGS